MLACWRRMDLCAVCSSAGLFGFYQSGQQKLCYTFQVWRALLQESELLLLLAGLEVPCSGNPSLFLSVWYRNLAWTPWLRTGESSQAGSVCSTGGADFDAIETWEATPVTAPTGPEAAHGFQELPDLWEPLVTCVCPASVSWEPLWRLWLKPPRSALPCRL